MVACVLTLAFGGFVLAAAAPTTTVTTTNEFGTRGYTTNGDVFVTSPIPTGDDLNGYIGRAAQTNGSVALGDFFQAYVLNEQRQGAGAVIARGPVGPNPGAVRSTNQYIYMVGGLNGTTVLDTIERAEIAADGSLFPPVGGPVAANLSTARYGAAVVAWNDYIYVIGGYGAGNVPLNTIERFTIDVNGDLGGATTMSLTMPFGIGDQAAAIINGWLYIAGGSTTARGAAQANTDLVARAQFLPNGEFEASGWEILPNLPLPTGGGRMFVLETLANTTSYLYFIGGNVGQDLIGATRNMYFLAIDNQTQAIYDPDAVYPPNGPGWNYPRDGVGNIIQTSRQRELFAAMVSNGYLYLVGGFNKTLLATTVYTSVERAQILPNGGIGGFTELANPITRINPIGDAGAGDVSGVTLNGHLYVPGGLDVNGGALQSIFELNLTPSFIGETATTEDAAFFSGILDFDGSSGDVYNFRFGVDYGNAGGSALFRFRTATTSIGDPYSGWSNWIAIEDLPLDSEDPGTGTLGRLHLLNLFFTPGSTTPCSNGVVPNPSGIQGPILDVQQVEWQVLIPEGADLANHFNEFTINRQLLGFALPGGYNPTNATTCAPNWARADYFVDAGRDVPGYTTRIVRLKGVGFPAFIGGETFNFLPVGDNAGDAPAITVNGFVLVDGATIDVDISIPTPAVAGTYVYDIEVLGGAFPIPLYLRPGLQVFPAVDVVDTGVDVDLVNPGNQNVVQILDASFTRQIGVFGANFRSGRVNESGSTAVDDDASPFGWPTYGEQGDTAPSPVLFNLNNKFTIVCVTDATQPAGGIAIVGGDINGCANVDAFGAAGLTEFINGGELRATLDFPPTTLSGAHELTVRVYNPSINSWDEAVNQTVYIIPYADITDVNTRADANSPALVLEPNPGLWAQANRGDGVVLEPLTINVVGTGFQSSTGTPLISNVIYIPSLGNGIYVAGGFTVNSFLDFDIDTDVPLNAPTGAYLVGFDWQYTPGVSDPIGAIPPSDATTVFYTWPTSAPGDRTAEAQTEQLGVYVLPPPPAIDSVFGNNCLGSIALLQGQPAEVKVNGNGFAVELPVYPTSTVIAVTLKSIVDPAEDLPATSWTVLGDRQLVAYFDVPPGQRAGQLYYLEIQTTIDTVVWPAGSPAAPISPLIVVVATPTCGDAFRVGTGCFYATPGEEAVLLEINGSNFGYNTSVDLGPGITILSKEVYRDATLIGPADGNTGNRILLSVTVADNAAAGARTVVISNGETCGLNQSCTLATPFFVVTAPTVTGIQPSLIQQPSLTEGIKIETIDIYGTNFTPGTTVSIEGIQVNNTIFMSSTHLKAEIVVEANTAGGPYTVLVTADSGTECAAGPTGTGTITIGVKPELFCETITPDQVSLGDGPTAITVRGKGLEGFDRMAIASGNAIYELSIGDETKDLNSITGILNPPAFAGFNYNLLGAQWDVVLQNSQTGAILYCQDQFAIFAGTVVTNFGGGDGAPTVCQGEVLNNLPVFGSNFLPNLGPANVSFGPAVQTRAVRVISPTELRIDVSITDGVSSIGTHALTITNPLPDGSQATLPGAVIVAAVPTVTGISDDTIAQGTSQAITISGSNFVPGTLVSVTPGEAGVFIPASSVTIVSESQITATLVSSDSSTLGTYSLVVTAPTPAGGAPKSCSTYTFSNAITNVAAPRIIRIDPSTVGAGMQEVNLTITGSGFQPGAQVFIGHGGSGDPRSEGYVTFCEGGSMIYVRPGGGFIDPTRIVVCVNVDENAFPMFIPFEVVNPDGGTAFAYDKFSVSVPNQPTPPSDLSAELFPGGKVNLVFQDNATNETGFVVEQSLNGGPWTVVKNLKALRGIGTITCTLTGLKPGNDYDYRVKAVNKSDGNIASPAAMLNSSVDVDSKITGKPVINLLEYVIDDKSYYEGVQIVWSGPSGGEVRSYSILRSTKGGPFVSLGAVDGSQTEYLDRDIVTGTKYSYKIEARNNFNTKVSSSKNITP
ncbi:MAG: hypothetical protein MUF27_14075 [Acidobacteria bacterium]|nr:hypothetical protein [Acidobacteriota bacterium]